MDAKTYPTSRQSRIISDALLGTLILICAELMFFSGLMSAYTISRANQLPGMWPPPGQPYLPAAATALNTVALLLSGSALLASNWVRNAARRRWLMWLSFCLGAAFVVLQGREWQMLLAQGLTLASSTIGSFFYLIVGAHGAHAIGALFALGMAAVYLQRGRMTQGRYLATQAFWYFVVLVWPIIYFRVYF